MCSPEIVATVRKGNVDRFKLECHKKPWGTSLFLKRHRHWRTSGGGGATMALVLPLDAVPLPPTPPQLKKDAQKRNITKGISFFRYDSLNIFRLREWLPPGTSQKYIRRRGFGILKLERTFTRLALVLERVMTAVKLLRRKEQSPDSLTEASSTWKRAKSYVGATCKRLGKRQTADSRAGVFILASNLGLFRVETSVVDPELFIPVRIQLILINYISK